VGGVTIVALLEMLLLPLGQLASLGVTKIVLLIVPTTPIATSVSQKTNVAGVLVKIHQLAPRAVAFTTITLGHATTDSLIFVPLTPSSATPWALVSNA